MERITLEFGQGRRCPVLIGPGAIDGIQSLWQPAWEQAAIIGDRRVVELHGDTIRTALSRLGVPVRTLVFPAGEAHKNRRTKAVLEDRLLARGFDRHGCVVAFGGGISLDVAGFVAATFLRGVAHLNVPTSLLAQVDAAIGGKTGVNTPRGKNLVGAFHQPAAVIVDPDWLASLPAEQWRNGLAELVKHAIIADAELFGRIERHAAELAVPGRLDVALLRRCLEIKAAIVCADEREAGLRAVLGFGHTVGHALERASGYDLPHGLAVACGMRIEAQLAVGRVGLSTAAVVRLEQLWRPLGFPPLPALRLPRFDRLLPWLAVDKKRTTGQLRMALPAEIGRMAGDGPCRTVAVTVAEVQHAYEDITGRQEGR